MKHLPLIVLLLTGYRLRAVEFLAGAAREDISPATPVRLSGYAARKTESTGVAQRLWAKALALSDSGGPPAVLITVDNCGVCAPIVEEVARRLQTKAGVPRERFTVVSSHTHCAPHTRGFAANIFVSDLPADQQARLDAYSGFLTDRMEAAALNAMAVREPAVLTWNQGQVTFARNRRTAGGPVDHTLPVLTVSSAAGGRTLAVVANYACHCTTLDGGFNQAHGDWAGCAQAELESRFPGSVAMITVGCGADANPHPRGTLELAAAHGRSIADEAESVIRNAGRPLTTPLTCRFQRLDLPFMPPMDRATWQRQSEQPGITGFLAKRKLAALDRDGSLPDKLPYSIQTWSFGDQLTMVFLAGETVVDYNLRLRERFDSERLWICGYANDVPCYIPSRRILAEGGYEAESSLWYYDRPSRLAPETEDLILTTAGNLIPPALRKENGTPPPPRTARDSLAAIRAGRGLDVELVASEPLITDPIAIDWDARGRLWVLEMGDYPLGTDGKLKPGGRIKRLDDTNGDGLPDKAVVFMEDIPFPTGLLCGPDGIYVCTAPDILYARDTNGDGRADDVKKPFTGWPTHNYNARVNSLSPGLDGWIYGSGGLFGGTIEPGHVDTSRRDFRFRPDTGALEAASGQTQQGRVRDDWDNWFGCDNSSLLRHYPFPESAARRHDRVPGPPSFVNVPSYPDPGRLYPVSRLMERFNEPGLASRVTSACGLGIYRDNWLGDEFYGNTFTCEAVHNLVRRHVLEPAGTTFAGRRSPDESEREFLASRDNWSRFVQARTGPDGALWLVDMYRFVIEHPTWIPEETQKRLDLRAGADKGRIYRLRARGKPLRPVDDLTTPSAAELAGQLDTPNGTNRDRIQLELLRRGDRASAIPLLEKLAAAAAWPAARAQAVAVLHALKPESPAIAAALKDPDARVRRIAVRFAAGNASTELAADPDPGVRYELALTAPGPDILRRLILSGIADQWMRAAILSAAGDNAGALLPAALSLPPGEEASALIDGLLALVREPAALIPALLPGDGRPPDTQALRAMAAWLKTGAIKPADVAAILAAVMTAADAGSPEALQFAARAGAKIEWLASHIPGPLESVALRELAALRDPGIPDLFLERWKSMGPSVHAAILRTLLTRPEWSRRIVDALKTGTIVPDEIPAAERQQLTASDPRAAELLGPVSSAPPAEKIRRLAGAEKLSGSAGAGQEVFTGLCASCHLLRGTGFSVGPDISAWGGKPLPDFLTAVAAPGLAIEPAFVACTVATADGRVRAGIIRDETASSLVIAQPGLPAETLLRRDVTAITPLRTSLMPEGLDAALTPQDVADLTAFLRGSAPADFGQSEAAQSDKARAEFIRTGSSLGRILKAGGTLPYPGWAGTRPLSFCRQNADENVLTWESKAGWQAAPDGNVTFRFAAASGFQSQPAGSFSLRIAGGEPVDFNVTLTDKTWRSADGRTILRYSVREANAEDSCGIATITCPAASLPAGKPVSFSVTGTPSGSTRWFGIYSVE